LRAISDVAAPCCSTAEAMAVAIVLTSSMVPELSFGRSEPDLTKSLVRANVAAAQDGGYCDQLEHIRPEPPDRL
jgi:hypothetical protein